MENERLSKVLPNCHLPEELCRDVLLRLPVKSLLRFRSVSKSWLSLISDPEFCRVHVKNFKSNRDETHLLVVKLDQLDCAVRCSDTFKTSAGTLVTLPPRFCGGDWSVNCPVDGLVLLEGPERNDIVVWNPSIRKFHDIPPSPIDFITRDSPFYDVSLGIGYDPLIKDYKHVRLIFDGIASLQLVEVYTLGDSSWKTIGFQGKESSNWNWVLNRPSKAIYLQGCLYFICTNLDNNTAEIVYFDLSSEVFGSISLPPVFPNALESDGMPVIVGYGTSSLALFDIEWGRIKWVVLDSSETESESFTWAKPCSLNLNVAWVLFLKRNLDVLLWWSDEEISFNLATDMPEKKRCCLWRNKKATSILVYIAMLRAWCCLTKLLQCVAQVVWNTCDP